jgi:cytochrome c peroxidase
MGARAGGDDPGSPADIEPVPPRDGLAEPEIGGRAHLGEHQTGLLRVGDLDMRGQRPIAVEGGPDEIGGAVVFAGKGACQACHSGPYLTDQRFHNLGLSGSLVPFTGVMTVNDPGAGLAAPILLVDPLNSRGKFSDGDDGRLDALPSVDKLEGAFKTPGLRCVSRRRTFMHNGEFRSLNDLIDFFDRGSSASGYVGTSENYPRGFTQIERDQLLAFLRALDGEGPPEDLLTPPELAP